MNVIESIQKPSEDQTKKLLSLKLKLDSELEGLNPIVKRVVQYLNQ
jgi:hypothetical protein